MIVENELTRILEAAYAKVADKQPGEVPAIVVAAKNPQFGDYQSNGAMGLAKQLGKKPRDVAQEVIDAAGDDLLAICDPPEIAGPGFINLRLSSAWLTKTVRSFARDVDRAGVPKLKKKDVETILIDYSSPNIAKPLHVGHIRSTIIGDALLRMFRFLGHTVISDNHIGDWGTQFGYVIYGFDKHVNKQAYDESPLPELERVYQLARAEAKQNPKVEETAREITAKLQAGDETIRSKWKEFVDHSIADVKRLYERMGIVPFDHWCGESFYEDKIPAAVHMLQTKGIAVESEGALGVFLPKGEFPAPQDDPDAEPFVLVRKRDGASLYIASDIAAIEYRVTTFNPSRIVYVVDARQALHFKQLFHIAGRAGFADIQFEHISFGTIFNADGKPLSTREGGLVRLDDLLQHAHEAARDRIVKSERVRIPEDEWLTAADQIGIGAIKYADLSQDRKSDYKFIIDKLVSLEGNTGPYLQYAHARLCSIFREVDEPLDWTPTTKAKIALDHEAEVGLARELIKFPGALNRAANDYAPHILATQLYELTRALSRFYENCSVKDSEGHTRTTRLALIATTRRQIAVGLDCLGIAALERM